jgi:protocatechuate 3,4-dioxygenase beta subunit
MLHLRQLSMTQMKCVGACALVLTMMCPPAAAQVTILPSGGGEGMQMPAPGRELKTGTGVIKGRLVTADSGGPVRRAQVRISGAEILPKSTTTDNEGRYEFTGLPAGRYSISATKSGYMTVNYGQTRPFESAKPIELADKQQMDGADITMPRGSVISGRIVDEFGEPVADVSVSAMRSTWSEGRRRLQATGRTSTTNDLGQYRIYGLPPGEYYVSATLRGTQEMMVTELAMVAAVRGGPAPETPRSGYAPTYYPGTASGSQAQRVSLSLGQEVQSTDFGLVPVRLVSVKGTVIGSNGNPLSGVTVTPTPRNTNESGFIRIASGARTDQNGNFTLNGVAPGEYTLNARSTMVFSATSNDGGRAVFTTRVMVAEGSGGDAQQEFGSVPLSVASDDIANVMIVTSKGISASGRVTWEGGAKPTVNTLRISAGSADGDNPLGMLGGSSSVTPEGTFEIKGLAGHRIFRVANVPSGWHLKAIKHGGQDITDTGVDIRTSEPLTNLEVVLTNKSTEINGTVKQGNEPATDYTVVIFSDDPQKWAVPLPRHIASARPNQEGRFQVKNLPAGGYYAVALEYIPQGDWFDPEVLERLKSKASSFSIDEGGVETLDLRLERMQ